VKLISCFTDTLYVEGKIIDMLASMGKHKSPKILNEVILLGCDVWREDFPTNRD